MLVLQQFHNVADNLHLLDRTEPDIRFAVQIKADVG